ncbi:MAG: hypothetical protein ACRC6K_08210 [Fusobacteriaceae bacterium]
MENLGFFTINSSVKDVDGGSVQTKHNIENEVYASEDMKYDRDTYVDQEKMNSYKKSKKNQDGTITSEITGNTIDGAVHTDHIISGKEYHTKMGFAQSEKERKESINCEENFSVIEGSANQSKSDQSLNEWKDNTQGGRNVKNEEHFNYNKEAAKETEKKDEKMRENIAKEQKKILGKYYSKESIKSGFSKGANMALKIAITESIAITTKETISYSKINTDTNTSFKDFLFVVIDGFKLGAKRLFKEIVLILKKMFMTLANGLLETIITTIINIFFTTVTSIIKLIRSIINIITDIKSKLSNLKDKSKAEKKKIFLSLLVNGILTLPILSGVGIIQAIEKVLLSLGIPNILSDILAIGLSNFIGGLLLIVVSRYLNEFGKTYNQKIANNIDLLNNRLKTKVSSIKAISAQIELENSLQIGLIFLENIKKEEEIFINSIKNNFNSFNETFDSLSSITISDSLNLSTERIFIKDNSNETKEMLISLRNIKF